MKSIVCVAVSMIVVMVLHGFCQCGICQHEAVAGESGGIQGVTGISDGDGGRSPRLSAGDYRRSVLKMLAAASRKRDRIRRGDDVIVYELGGFDGRSGERVAQLDLNKDGVVTKIELRKGMRRLRLNRLKEAVSGGDVPGGAKPLAWRKGEFNEKHNATIMEMIRHRKRIRGGNK